MSIYNLLSYSRSTIFFKEEKVIMSSAQWLLILPNNLTLNLIQNKLKPKAVTDISASKSTEKQLKQKNVDKETNKRNK